MQNRIMKLVVLLLACLGVIVVLSAATTKPSAKKTYVLKGDYLEGCECNSVCPCIWSHDASNDQCRAIMVWKVTEGRYGSTNLKGLTFAGSLTKSGKNIEKTAGSWEGVLFVPEAATPAQREALAAIINAEWGSAFSALNIRTAPVEMKGTPGYEDVTIGSIGHLKITPLKNAKGQVPKIVNPPSPLALPVNYCAKADINTYDDGTSSWNFAGRNSFYGPFEMVSK